MNHTLLIGIVTAASAILITFFTYRKEKADDEEKENEKIITRQKHDTLTRAQQKAIDILLKSEEKQDSLVEAQGKAIEILRNTEQHQNNLAKSQDKAIDILQKNQIVYQDLLRQQKEVIRQLTGGDSWIYFKVYIDAESRVNVVAELIGDTPIESAYIDFYDMPRDASFHRTLLQTLRPGHSMFIENDMKELLSGENIHVSIFTHLGSGTYKQQVTLTHTETKVTALHVVYKNGIEILRHDKRWNFDIKKIKFNPETGIYTLQE